MKDINDLLRELLRGQQGVRHELTECLASGPKNRRCPVCGAERHYKNEPGQILCNGHRMYKKAA